MSTLSANTLFHFTRNKENLISILKSNFRPCYCSEKNYLVRRTWKVPIVCFCDIPLSQVEEHTSWYGEYAIGMTKEWAIKNNVNPVMYINEKVKLINTIKSNFDFLIEQKSCNTTANNDIQSIINKMLYQHAYIKPYQGMQFDKKQEANINKRYYDEREWRYVAINKDKSLFEFATAFFSGQREALNDSIKEYGLNFEPKDINYIIVSKEYEILEIKRKVEDIKGNFSRDDVELLTTRIISMERIREDF
ncbi:abortive infection system antitoxin AbiGi family protein [Bacteroides fragilis]|uniref:abortive infection system antitoxin AbiGi family protein n=1 Tax=Bacteroides fragilis TaxID=817 RepID=UPI001C705261|nr:abortive infection system antitoxin AbiGi family protein [Bacteroides fragilis]MBW9277453.1 hypothetical protein [Bacteroides fragilis]